MIPAPSAARVWIAAGHTDMRRGMNGLSLLVQEGLKRDPFAGCQATSETHPLATSGTHPPPCYSAVPA